MGETGWMEKTPRAIKWLAKLLKDRTKRKVWHNAKYDLGMLHYEGIDVFSDAVRRTNHCTLTMAKVIHSTGLDFSLKGLAARHLHRSSEDKDGVIVWLKQNARAFKNQHGRKPNFSDCPRDILIPRALWDVESTLLLDRYLYRRTQKVCPELYATERDLLFVCVDMETTGVQVDITHAKKLRKASTDALAILDRHLQRMAGEFTIVRKKKGVDTEELCTEFNPNSRLHMPAVFTKLGIKLVHKTKPKKKKGGGMSSGGGWAFDEESILKYVNDATAAVIKESGEEGWPFKRWWKAVQKASTDPRNLLPAMVLKFRELGKMVSTYYDHIIEESVGHWKTPAGHEYAILHCKFNPTEAKTGRFSSSEPNLQNMPRLLGPRECFVPRRGRRNWHLDYSQVEMKFFVHFAEDDTMAAAINDDLHRATASVIYRIPADKVTKEQRKRAKAVNFGIIYGSGVATLRATLISKGLPTTMAQAERLMADYHRGFPKVRKLTAEFERELKNRGYVVNPFGRRYHIPAKRSYVALNYMCQGTSADLIKLAMVRIWKWLRAKGLKTKLIVTIHDEVVLEVPPVEAPVVIPAVTRMMEDHDNFYVPITVDQEVVRKRWSNKRDISLTDDLAAA